MRYLIFSRRWKKIQQLQVMDSEQYIAPAEKYWRQWNNRRDWSEDIGEEQLFYRCELFNEIISVVVWPDPLKFRSPITDYPMGPIAGRFPIVCMAKRQEIY